jgi:hypothetical protein
MISRGIPRYWPRIMTPGKCRGLWAIMAKGLRAMNNLGNNCTGNNNNYNNNNYNSNYYSNNYNSY